MRLSLQYAWIVKDLRVNEDILNCYAAGEYIHLSLKKTGKG